MDGDLVLTIPEPTPTPNTWLHKHWSTYHRIKKRWHRLIGDALLEQHNGRYVMADRCEVHVERASTSPIHDIDNLYGGLKPVLDCLVKLRVIRDDSDKVITDLSVIQVRVHKKKDHRTRIVIRRPK